MPERSIAMWVVAYAIFGATVILIVALMFAML